MGMSSAPPTRTSVEQRLSLFMDFENIVRGVKEAQYKQFEIQLVLERLVEKGKIMVKRAYADWTRYAEYKRPFHEHAIELIDVPQSSYSGKNSADIRMVVDAMDLGLASSHVDTFASGLGRLRLLPAGVQAPGERQLRDRPRGQDLDRPSCSSATATSSSSTRTSSASRKTTTALAACPRRRRKRSAQLIDAVQALQRENKDTLWGSMVKQTMIRKNPAFNESYYGYSTFSKLLEDAERHGLLTLKKDAKSGGYVVSA